MLIFRPQPLLRIEPALSAFNHAPVPPPLMSHTGAPPPLNHDAPFQTGHNAFETGHHAFENRFGLQRDGRYPMSRYDAGVLPIAPLQNENLDATPLPSSRYYNGPLTNEQQPWDFYPPQQISDRAPPPSRYETGLLDIVPPQNDNNLLSPPLNALGPLSVEPQPRDFYPLQHFDHRRVNLPPLRNDTNLVAIAPPPHQIEDLVDDAPPSQNDIRPLATASLPQQEPPQIDTNVAPPNDTSLPAIEDISLGPDENANASVGSDFSDISGNYSLSNMS